MDKAQKGYYLREQLKAIRKEVGRRPRRRRELEDITKAIEKGRTSADVRKADKRLGGSPRCTATRRKPASYALSTGG